MISHRTKGALLAIAMAVVTTISASSPAFGGSTDEIRSLLSENPYDAARLPAETLCNLDTEARSFVGISEQSVLCEALNGSLEAPEGMDANSREYFERITDTVDRGLEILEEQEEYSSAEMTICKKILCAAAPDGPGSIAECEDDSGPSDIIVAITRGKRPQCPMVQW